jgi:hypothetical protein
VVEKSGGWPNTMSADFHPSVTTTHPQSQPPQAPPNPNNQDGQAPPGNIVQYNATNLNVVQHTGAIYLIPQKMSQHAGGQNLPPQQMTNGSSLANFGLQSPDFLPQMMHQAAGATQPQLPQQQ